MIHCGAARLDVSVVQSALRLEPMLMARALELRSSPTRRNRSLHIRPSRCFCVADRLSCEEHASQVPTNASVTGSQAPLAPHHLTDTPAPLSTCRAESCMALPVTYKFNKTPSVVMQHLFRMCAHAECCLLHCMFD